MYITSQNYKDNIVADVRETMAEVILNITSVVDNQVKGNSTEFEISNSSQLVNSEFEGDYNLITYETDRVRLDGSFNFASGNKTENKEVGFISNQLCDMNGNFSSFPFVEIEKTGEMEFFGCSIFFDNLQNEYAVDFDIEVYKGNTLLKTIVILDNKDIEFTAFDESISDFDSMKIIIKKWSKPERRVRIIEAECGVIKVYNGDKLVKLKLIEEMDFEGDKIMIPEIEIEVLDEKREYDFLNPQGIYKYLNTNLNITAEIGLVTPNGNIEKVPLGKYKLQEWKKKTNEMTTRFTARHSLEGLIKYNIYESNFTTFYEIIENIFIVSGVTDYFIDNHFNNIITFGKHEKMNARELLQNCLIATGGRIYVNRVGKVFVIKDLMTSKTTDIALDKSITQPEVEMENPIKSIKVEYYSDINDLEQMEEYEEVLGEDGDVMEVNGNTLINSLQQAKNVVDYWKAKESYRATSTVNWRGDASVELGDLVGVETAFGMHNGYVTSNEIEFNGALKETSKVRQKVNL